MLPGVSPGIVGLGLGDAGELEARIEGAPERGEEDAEAGAEQGERSEVSRGCPCHCPEVPSWAIFHGR